MQPGYGTPYVQPGYPQPGYPQPGYPGAGGPPPAGFVPPGYGNPGYGPAATGFMAHGMGSPTMSGGAEAGGDFEGSMSAFGSKAVRMGFIRKVYSILSVQLIITFGFILIFTLNDDSKVWAARNSWLLILALVGSIASLITLACCGNVRRQFPLNFICLGIFTLAQAFSLGIVTAFYRTNIVWLAVLMTAAVCIGLTIFAMQTKIDFTVYSGVMFVALIILSVCGLILMFVRIPILHVIYSGFGALIFCVYLIIDTQMIVGGGHKNEISPEEYIFGAITLYTDIINIFMYLLQILNYASSD